MVTTHLKQRKQDEVSKVCTGDTPWCQHLGAEAEGLLESRSSKLAWAALWECLKIREAREVIQLLKCLLCKSGDPQEHWPGVRQRQAELRHWASQCDQRSKLWA